MLNLFQYPERLSAKFSPGPETSSGWRRSYRCQKSESL